MICCILEELTYTVPARASSAVSSAAMPLAAHPTMVAHLKQNPQAFMKREIHHKKTAPKSA
jgi:hypothetical protein